jgi:SAM-dependent methyltransferase/GT2 family glycosyltransferase
MAAPRVSIMIPNFDNGRRSSRDGERNFIADLLQSLVDTLKDDPTPLEIIVGDDGSSDDSLATCREWAGRSWPEASWRAGERVLRLLEWPHCGVLSRVANRLMREARGEILVRLDGDIVVHTANWASRLCEVFDRGPERLGVIGPKQLAPDGRIHAAGDFILHARGYHHVGQGAAREAVREPLEVDHVMGCFYCYRRAVWDDVGEYDETILRGQTEDLGLRARLRGWRAFVEPSIEFTHHHVQRLPRRNVADTGGGLRTTLDRFREKWGFDRLAPDLEDVAARYAGTPLLWNRAVFAALQETDCGGGEPVPLTATAWARYGSDGGLQAAVEERLRAAGAVATNGSQPRRVAYLASREGLVCHLLAMQGIDVSGIDPDEHMVRLAREVTARAEYPGAELRPRFVQMTHDSRLPLADESVDAVLLFDVLETHPNPVRLLREAQRVAAPGGLIAILSARRVAVIDEADMPRVGGAAREVIPPHPFRAHELNGLLRHIPGLEIVRPAADSSGSLLLAIARTGGEGAAAGEKAPAHEVAAAGR